MSRSPDDRARSDPPPAAPDGGAGFDLRGLPDRVKGLGLPPAAVAAIGRYWAPTWDAIADQLALLPVHPAPAARGGVGRRRVSDLRGRRREAAGPEVACGCSRRCGRPTAAGSRSARRWSRPVRRWPACPSTRRRTSRPSTAPGDAVTVYVGPDRRPDFRDVPATTNHQRRVDWPEYVRAIRSVEREQRQLDLLGEADMNAERRADAFLEPPLYSTSHAGGFGTIYTAAHSPAERRVAYRWFEEPTHVQAFSDGEVSQWHP